MIKSFISKETEKVWNGSRSGKFPNTIQETARRKLRMLNNSVDLKDLTIPPSNKLEKLKGNRKDYYSIRVNDQWRIIFKWINGHSYNVDIVDYH
jgi:toxin HigB-1